LVGEIRVFLIVRLAIDINFMKIVESCSNVEDLETDLKHNEEEQGDYNDRNEREGNFSYVGHGTLSSDHRLKPIDIRRTIAVVNIA
jgi:hypothetical protein